MPRNPKIPRAERLVDVSEEGIRNTMQGPMMDRWETGPRDASYF